jgi:hypothetical protein|nr:MAG TPA: hypothetical protein [Caudoviricetes sp.]
MILIYQDNQIKQCPHEWHIVGHPFRECLNTIPEDGQRYLLCDYGGQVFGMRDGAKPVKRVYFDHIYIIQDDRHDLPTTPNRIARKMAKFANRWKHETQKATQ